MMEFLEEECRVTQKLVNVKCYLVFMGIFIFKPASQFVELYQHCVLIMEVLISNCFYVNSVSNKENYDIY
jgi:hypothetical protein